MCPVLPMGLAQHLKPSPVLLVSKCVHRILMKLFPKLFCPCIFLNLMQMSGFAQVLHSLVQRPSLHCQTKWYSFSGLWPHLIGVV